ncbi:MAG TPA: nucleoside triphosphate pyrophosphohydrolase [Candidatus Limnocylindrales bacterium]|nr:nucleoside triphosphate pyrophosphohydrolase [Candidatus Limnocylindrales bacterium]
MPSKKLSSRHKDSKPKPRRAKKSSRPRNPGPAFAKLAAVMARLRAPGGCPWDREQTHSTLRTYLIEEAYEVLDALDSRDDSKFAEELGDLLLQVLFHAQIAAESRRFSITDVIREIHDKMIRRHPHVFGNVRAKTSAQVLRNWELLKKQERQSKAEVAPASSRQAQSAPALRSDSEGGSLLDGVPHTIPALLEAFQLTRKAARIGFDWENVEGIFDKLREESAELRDVLNKKESDARIEGELGDILFVAVNLSRFLNVDPEIALHKASAKFTCRFHEMERIAREKGTTLAEIPRPQLESLWDQSKQRELQAAKQ